jgi:hypothetical protein
LNILKKRERQKIFKKFWFGKVEERGHFKELSLDDRIILKSISIWRQESEGLTEPLVNY